MDIIMDSYDDWVGILEDLELLDYKWLSKDMPTYHSNYFHQHVGNIYLTLDLKRKILTKGHVHRDRETDFESKIVIHSSELRYLTLEGAIKSENL